MIPLSVPNIAGNEWLYIKECLDTNWVSSLGKYVTLFEERLAEYTGAKHVIALSNGTSALHLALLACGLQENQEVLVPTLTFISPVNAIRYCRAWPVFMDCDDSYCLSVEKVTRFLELECRMENGMIVNKKSGRTIWGIVPVHVFGNPVEMDLLADLAQAYKLQIVEDAAESLGSFFKGQHTGTFGNCGCLSFNGNKIITTGGGGAVLCKDGDIADRIRYLSTQAKDDPLRFVHGDIGYNYRLTSIQAAMGVAQLEKLPEFIESKRRNFKSYQQALSNINGLSLYEAPTASDANFWFYCLQLDPLLYHRSRDELMEALAAKDIQTRPVWYPNHLQKMYKGCQAFEIENAVRLWEQTVNIPCSTNLSESEIAQVITALREA
ncbi:MAG: LegC family aminotransferase [SAR324 cluster bacterium]|uniref:LegC family aminotransferase n=1 Tax=SAR324 cluster bacterium TaxID=2024889 RepID=A0A7X9FRD2_9DELT|nr:LegC family aminotransferase [SAR324 cluster bacterium]